MKDYSEKSFWLATYGEYTPNPPVKGDLSVDVAIIGGGFTGLATAYNLRKDDPGMKVAVLEAEVVGFGASGRNGGFSMTLFGLEPAVTKSLFGHQRTVEAHRYMERAVDYVDALVKEHKIQSDYEFHGFRRAAAQSLGKRGSPPARKALAALLTIPTCVYARRRLPCAPPLTNKVGLSYDQEHYSSDRQRPGHFKMVVYVLVQCWLRGTHGQLRT